MTVKKEISADINRIVRLRDIDIDGLLLFDRALLRVKGVGHAMASFVRVKMGFPASKRIGELSEAEIAKVSDIILNPKQYGLPSFMFNRQKNSDTGEDKHLSAVDLDIEIKGDISFMKNIKSYKGVRHAAGLKVRGQRTGSTGRKGIVVGVKKKSVLPAKAEGEK